MFIFLPSMLGEKAPQFTLPSWNLTKIEDISLDIYKGKYVVLIFYPHDFTFVCPTEINGFSKKKDEFENLNATILFISGDSVYVHKAWTEREVKQGGIKDCCYPIISDIQRKMLADYQMLNKNGVSFRGTVIIDKEGVVKAMFYYDGKVGRSVKEVVRVLKCLRKLEEADGAEFCPLDYEAE